MNKNVSELNRKRFITTHSETMFKQLLFPDFDVEGICKDKLAYHPSWGILDASMTMEKHRHPIAEIYVFVQGKGQMLLGSKIFDVCAGMSVNIPPNIDHELTNPDTAVNPLIWVYIGLKVE